MYKTLRIRNQEPSKRKTWPPPSEVEDVRIVVISFRNIAKKRRPDLGEEIAMFFFFASSHEFENGKFFSPFFFNKISFVLRRMRNLEFDTQFITAPIEKPKKLGIENEFEGLLTKYEI